MPGPAAASFGIYCAQLSGIQHHVLTRATQILALQEKGRYIPRAESALQKARDERSLDTVKRLAALEVQDPAAVQHFLESLIDV